MLIKYALEDFSPIEAAFFKASIGAIGLLAIVLFQGGRARAAMGDILRRPLPAVLLGLLAIAGPFILISLGELSVPRASRECSSPRLRCSSRSSPCASTLAPR